MAILLVILAIIVFLVFFAISLYNRLVKLRNNREQAFADVDVQLKQRHDLIPQLVETVKGYMVHEREVLTTITEARANAMKASSVNEKIEAETKLTSALQGLRVAVENYPDLKASQNFMDLQNEISDVENKIAAARRFSTPPPRSSTRLPSCSPLILLQPCSTSRGSRCLNWATSAR